MVDKIRQSHRDRWAYVYLRQSSMGQVRHNRESTKRQYALKDRAEQLGWPPQRIRVLDRDLGISGTDLTNREDFKLLVADVSMKKVGAVFALEASRLSRSCSDWHRLVELCSFTGTLMMDEDGCYDPADFNDSLLLGIKGTISHAELHFIRARLHGGRMAKVRRGEYRQALPVGLRYDDTGMIVKEPDAEVCGAITLLFRVYRQTGSAQGVVRHFAAERLCFPKRSYTGVNAGKIVWGPLGESRVVDVLRNPKYAGTYAYGQKHYGKRMDAEGRLVSCVRRVPMSSWEVCMKNHHGGYISWEEYMHNLRILEDNRTTRDNPTARGVPRRGPALLQGLVLCGKCGHQLTTAYKGTGGIYPTYECSWRKRNGIGDNRYCLSIRSYLVDDPVCERALKTVEPAQVQIAQKVLEELQRRDEAVDKQWRMKVERARYEADLAQRRYEEVDPSNRLVASTLERRWNDALEELEQASKQYEERRARHSLTATEEQRRKVLALAKDLPRLWRSPTTATEDRKRLLRLLIKDVTVDKHVELGKAVAHVRWQGGATEDIPIALPPPQWERARCPAHIVDRIRELAANHGDTDIARVLNSEGHKPPKRDTFTAVSVGNLRRSHHIASPGGRPGEVTVADLAKRLDTSRDQVRALIADGRVTGRKAGRRYWIDMSATTENALKALIVPTRRQR
jgi:DNA invertase Pin-like site-specific DNA recombinase